MPCPELKVVVLDCDGVILESVDVKTRAFAASVQEYGPEAVKRLVDFHMAHGGVSRYEKYRHFHREHFGSEIAPELLDELARRFAEGALQGVLDAPFVPGALEFIEYFHGRLPLYVASGTPQAELREIFAKRGLDAFFKGIYGAPDTKSDILARIVAAEGVTPAETLMVGDSSTDLKAAVAVGTLFYGRGDFPAHPHGPDLSGLTTHVAELLGCA